MADSYRFSCAFKVYVLYLPTSLISLFSTSYNCYFCLTSCSVLRFLEFSAILFILLFAFMFDYLCLVNVDKESLMYLLCFYVY